MSPFIVIVASIHLSISGTINIVAQPSENLDECRTIGELAIKAATVEPALMPPMSATTLPVNRAYRVRWAWSLT